MVIWITCFVLAGLGRTLFDISGLARGLSSALFRGLRHFPRRWRIQEALGSGGRVSVGGAGVTLSDAGGVGAGSTTGAGALGATGSMGTGTAGRADSAGGGGNGGVDDSNS